MTGQLHPGSHPDADSLSAFLEGVLPEHERLECLAHFAECRNCREAVFQAQQPPTAPATAKPVRVWPRWFAPIPVLSGALAACGLAMVIVLYLRHAPAPPAHYTIARAKPSQPSAASLPKSTPAPKHAAPPSKATHAERRAPVEVASAAAAAPIAPPRAMEAAPPPPSPAPSVQADAAQSQAPALNRPAPPWRTGQYGETVGHGESMTSVVLNGGALRLQITHDQGPANGLSDVTGVITDQSGAVVPGTVVTLRSAVGEASGKAQSDAAGRFTIAALPPGRYEMQIEAPGFRTSSGQIELQARDVAMVASVLSVGSTAESVQVEAAESAVSTPEASADEKLAKFSTTLPLPANILPGTAAVTMGKRMLAVDSSGGLLFSGNAGKRWKAVKPQWAGKVAKLAIVTDELPAKARPVFQLTTQSGAIWLSRNGTHWSPSPPQR